MQRAGPGVRPCVPTPEALGAVRPAGHLPPYADGRANPKHPNRDPPGSTRMVIAYCLCLHVVCVGIENLTAGRRHAGKGVITGESRPHNESSGENGCTKRYRVIVLGKVMAGLRGETEDY